MTENTYHLPDGVLIAENNRITKRRAEAERLGLMKKNSDTEVKGLALSGGGIRAAFIARGLIEVFAKNGTLVHFDYISSVSGGGYAACMLTEHVGTLRKSPTFNPETYRLQAPPYNLAGFVLGALIDPLVNFFPVLAYLCLFFLFPFHNRELTRLILITTCIVLALAGIGDYFVTRWRSRTARDMFQEFVSRRKIYLYFLFPALVAVATTWIGYLFPMVAIVVLMLATGLFVSSRPHRFYRTGNPAFVLLFLALLVVIAVALVDWSTQYYPMLFKLIIMLLGLAFLVVPLLADIPRQNKTNLIFKFYREGLEAVFLPFAKWLTKRYHFHEVGQSWNPYPIVNAAANFGRGLDAFEIAPLYSGSEKSGYHSTKQWMPNLKLSDAMAISGSAFDPLKNPGTFSALFGALAGGTDYWIPTQGRQDQKGILSLARLWTLVGGRPAGALRLSDGGFVENLGVLALIKRRSKVIVCLDAGYDPRYTFEDLRQLCVMIRNLGLGQLNLVNIELASQSRQFRQNTSNILSGTIQYPARNGEPPETGIYIHLKISGARCPMQGQFVDFPHLTTLDQQLKDEEISALYSLGREMAEELYASPFKKTLFK